jgi:predicted kinase
MKRKVLYVIRGLPGSGKTTLAATLSKIHLEADMYFTGDDGVYRFDPARVQQAHAWCRNAVATEMQNNADTIAVSNTFTQKWEVQPYLDLAANYGYDVQIIHLSSPWDNIHNVPTEAIQRMRARWEHFTI